MIVQWVTLNASSVFFRVAWVGRDQTAKQLFLHWLEILGSSLSVSRGLFEMALVLFGVYALVIRNGGLLGAVDRCRLYIS